ncbi:MAG TPA: hypothetical protein VJI75_00455 [Candidatus Nanoarchaeia archaeon]|nr:hypothetical protein [Candidatus Nanoarchaeia archaeon]
MNDMLATGTSTPIKKGTDRGLGDLVRDMTVPAPEKERKARIEGEVWLEEALKEYENTFETEGMIYEELFDKIVNQSLPVLTSGQINQFIEATIEYEEHKKYLDRTGLFVSALIQIAYNAGFNDFVLEPKGTQPLNMIGAYLKGTEKDPIRLTNNARTGDSCGWRSEYINITNNTRTGYNCGGYTKYSIMTSYSQIKSGCGWNAEHSIYKTNNPETLRNILYNLNESSGNKVIFIHPDGTEEIRAHYE